MLNQLPVAESDHRPRLYGTNSAICSRCIGYHEVNQSYSFSTQDNTLNNIFSTVYGFVVIESGLFLATCCLRVLKREDERALKIDRKSGVKGGFV